MLIFRYAEETFYNPKIIVPSRFNHPQHFVTSLFLSLFFLPVFCRFLLFLLNLWRNDKIHNSIVKKIKCILGSVLISSLSLTIL